MNLGLVPSNPQWCSYCVRSRGNTEPTVDKIYYSCPYHLPGPNGAPLEYSGPSLYVPSEWVLQVVGHRYNTLTGVCLCFGYDPRHGFWMRDEVTGLERNVSERAIGRSCHRIWE